MDLASAKKEYLASLGPRSPLTVSTYGYALDRLFHYLFQRHSIIDGHDVGVLTLSLIHQYSLWLEEEKLRDRTRFKYLVVVRNWVKYLSRGGHLDVNWTLIKLPIYVRSLPDAPEMGVLRMSMSRRVQPHADDEWRTTIWLRNTAMLELLFSTGITISELIGLDRASVNLESGMVVVPSKIRQPRAFQISDSVVLAIRAYIEARKDQATALFVHHDRAHRISGGDPVNLQTLRLSRQGAERTVKEWLGGATPQSIRHARAFAMITDGRSLVSLANHLGISPGSATRYVEAAER